MADFEFELKTHIPRLRRYAHALVGDATSADDLVQDCLERAWTRQHLWDTSLAIRPWLFTIMHNLYANAARQYHSRPQFVPLNQLDELQQTSQEANLSLRDFESALGQLSEEHREILLLVGLEQLSYKETSEVLNIPIGTVMSRLKRARQKIKFLMMNQPAPNIRRIK
jgi:RNA polymerase sigma-70 factor (ECF subfamily)